MADDGDFRQLADLELTSEVEKVPFLREKKIQVSKTLIKSIKLGAANLITSLWKKVKKYYHLKSKRK